MRKPALAGLLLCALLFGAQSPTVSAEATVLIEFDTKLNAASQLALKEVTEGMDGAPPKPLAPPAIKHAVKVNETLSSIAKQHKTTWKRLYDKNLPVTDPDLIKPGSKLVIPAEDEDLKPRPLSAKLRPTTARSGAKEATGASEPVRFSPRGSASGNGYVRGYCTWYVKNKRPDLPNNLGNADTWVARARAQGIPTGSSPRVGAIGQKGMHVVYVEKVHSNGTVTISEMNFKGWNVVSSRTVAASTFMYIY